MIIMKAICLVADAFFVKSSNTFLRKVVTVHYLCFFHFELRVVILLFALQ